MPFPLQSCSRLFGMTVYDLLLGKNADGKFVVKRCSRLNDTKRTGMYMKFSVLFCVNID
jgi:hypothetical protein